MTTSRRAFPLDVLLAIAFYTARTVGPLASRAGWTIIIPASDATFNRARRPTMLHITVPAFSHSGWLPHIAALEVLAIVILSGRRVCT